MIRTLAVFFQKLHVILHIMHDSSCHPGGPIVERYVRIIKGGFENEVAPTKQIESNPSDDLVLQRKKVATVHECLMLPKSHYQQGRINRYAKYAMAGAPRAGGPPVVSLKKLG
jgi:hypothetical protein